MKLEKITEKNTLPALRSPLHTPIVQGFFDPITSTITYVIYEDVGTACAIVDSVLDYDPKAGATSTASADKIIDFIREKKLTVQWLLETHAHADHFSAAPYLRQQLGGKIAIGEQICTVQDVFKNIYHLGSDFAIDGSQFDHLFAPDEIFHIGNLQAQAWHVPGHTPADMAYLVEEKTVFVGDTLFMPDLGSARCDFPGGSAHMLYDSMHRLLRLPDDVCLYLCHDYPPENRAPAWIATVAQQRAKNIHIGDGISEEKFTSMRKARDATLGMPTLMLPAIQVNIRAGNLPQPEENGVQYLKIPLNQF
ncbi:MAG: MBL fold metallo-hydrolase [Glaciimonas sp.]|nr:MBL fold metallo-hydrolase [Glaciimonas sp.]